MKELDAVYLRLLSAGVALLQEAAAQGDREWMFRESEQLHEFPTLVGEENFHRHAYHRYTTTMDYLGWLRSHASREIQLRSGSVYLPLWKQYDEVAPVDFIQNKMKEERRADEVIPPPACHYLHILHGGLVWTRNTARTLDIERVRVEVHHLRNFPMLIGSDDSSLHRAYLREDYVQYLSWFAAHPAEESAESFCQPAWAALHAIYDNPSPPER